MNAPKTTMDTKIVTPAGMPDNTHPTVGWLWTLTDPWRSMCARPWTYVRDGKTLTVGTNGVLIAFVEGAFGFDRAPGTGPEAMPGARLGFDVTFDRFPKSASVPFPIAALRALLDPPSEPRPDCEECNNTGVVGCADCEGAKTHDCLCYCGHEHEAKCFECNGSGEVACECGRNPAPKDGSKTVVRIGFDTFDLALFRAFVPYMPDDAATWAQDRPEGCALLCVGPWSVGVMPLRLNSDDPPRISHVIELPVAERSAGVPS